MKCSGEFSPSNPTNQAYMLATGACALAVTIWLVGMRLKQEPITLQAKLICAAVIATPPAIRLTHIALKSLGVAEDTDDDDELPGEINWANIGKLPPRLRAVLPDTPGHPRFVELLEHLDTVTELKSQTRNLVERLVEKLTLQPESDKATGNLVKCLSIFLRGNQAYRDNAVKFLQQSLDAKQPIETALNYAANEVCAAHGLPFPDLPGPPNTSKLIDAYLKYVPGATKTSAGYKNFRAAVNECKGGAENYYKHTHIYLQHMVDPMESDKVSDETKERVLRDMGDKFGECKPSWVESSRRAAEQLFCITEPGEDTLLRLAKGVRDEIVLLIAQRYDPSQWHGLNKLRILLGKEAGLDAEDAKGDQHNNWGHFDKEAVLKEFRKEYTAERLVTGVQAQLAMRSPTENELVVRDVLCEAVKEGDPTTDLSLIKVEADNSTTITDKAVKIMLRHIGLINKN